MHEIKIHFNRNVQRIFIEKHLNFVFSCAWVSKEWNWFSVQGCLLDQTRQIWRCSDPDQQK